MRRLYYQEENGLLMQWFAKVAILFAIFSISTSSLICSVSILLYIVRHWK
jgi:hypothetical protein